MKNRMLPFSDDYSYDDCTFVRYVHEDSPRCRSWPFIRGYDAPDVMFYSHAHLPGQEDHVIDQVIEAMLPTLRQVAPLVAETWTVAEWWVHHRRPEQWHGHPMHFDTNAARIRVEFGS